jgi:hypothetical protein
MSPLPAFRCTLHGGGNPAVRGDAATSDPAFFWDMLAASTKCRGDHAVNGRMLSPWTTD